VSAAARCTLFSLVFALAYSLSYTFDWSLFQYYPLVGEIHRMPQPPAAGTPMMWYGWIATAALLALTAALLVPARWSEQLPAGWTWLVTTAALVYVLIYERHWFLMS
jgi:hypothetical protein